MKTNRYKNNYTYKIILLILTIFVSFSFAWDDYEDNDNIKNKKNALELLRDSAKIDKGDLLNGYLKYRKFLTSSEKNKLLTKLDVHYAQGNSEILQTLLYERGAYHFANDEYGQAIQIFSKISDEYPSIKIKAVYSTARSYKQLLNRPEALVHYNLIALNYPESTYHDDALFWQAHLEEDYYKSAELYANMLDKVDKGDHRQGALERLVQLRIDCGDAEAAKITINRFRAELPHGFENELTNLYIENYDYEKSIELLKKSDNNWPGRFKLARKLIENLIFNKTDPKKIREIYKKTISASYKEIKKFDSYLKTGDVYNGFEAFTFMKAKKRLCYPDSLASIAEVLEFPQLFGDPLELIYTYSQALNLNGNDREKAILINKISNLMLREGLYHAYNSFSKQHNIYDDVVAKREKELYFKYLSYFDPTRTIIELFELGQREKDDYIIEKLLALTDHLKPDISEMKKHLNRILLDFPDSKYREKALYRLMRIYYFVDDDPQALLNLYDDIHVSKDLPLYPEMTQLRLASLARLSDYDTAINETCFYSLLDNHIADICFKVLIENAISANRFDIVDSLKQYKY